MDGFALALGSKGAKFQAGRSLITHFRNRAAHIDELEMDDYVSCRDLVIGSEGRLWKLVVATERHKRNMANNKQAVIHTNTAQKTTDGLQTNVDKSPAWSQRNKSGPTNWPGQKNVGASRRP
jgi:hypothetical protein